MGFRADDTIRRHTPADCSRQRQRYPRANTTQNRGYPNRQWWLLMPDVPGTGKPQGSGTSIRVRAPDIRIDALAGRSPARDHWQALLVNAISALGTFGAELETRRRMAIVSGTGVMGCCHNTRDPGITGFRKEIAFQIIWCRQTFAKWAKLVQIKKLLQPVARSVSYELLVC